MLRKPTFVAINFDTPDEKAVTCSWMYIKVSLDHRPCLRMVIGLTTCSEITWFESVKNRSFLPFCGGGNLVL